LPWFETSGQLTIADFLTVLCIGAGAAIMFLSVLKTSKLRKMLVEGVNTARWTWLARLMVFFFIGYLIAIFLVVFGYQEPLLLLTGLVFLLGSFFVYLVVYSAKSDIQKIYDAHELLVQKNIELRKINLELDQFAYRTSHDLKAPITSLKGLIQIAQLSTSREETEQCHAMMKDRLLNLEELIRDILDLSKNSRTEMDYVQSNIPALIRQMIASHAEIKGNAEIIYDGPDELVVYTDPTRFRMVVGNLLSNALHYADVKKSKHQITIKCAAEGKFFLVVVKDNGVGIDPQYHEKIFEMFFRLSENSIGSGLGLYIVRETTEKMNGTLEVISEKGIGSEFKVRLPLFVDKPGSEQ
jgi:signal transduction histidine kinase